MLRSYGLKLSDYSFLTIASTENTLNSFPSTIVNHSHSEKNSRSDFYINLAITLEHISSMKCTAISYHEHHCIDAKQRVNIRVKK